ncbi:MAG: ATP-grasp domain-containing protein [Chromatiales bacterium]|nr:ATP-grasp domain-containing protein [Chromatiales bacterium]
MGKITRLLIANRGEIAVRIVRACAEMGIHSVAVYSDADREGLHVKMADEAHSLGPEPLRGYLDAEGLVQLAGQLQCDAIHPGYGFLAESPLLAAACEREGIRYVGPSSAVIQHLGDKLAARRSAIEAGLPVTTGSDENLSNIEQAVHLAAEIGYPVMLKATGGGGGRGIRRCNDVNELRQGFARVASEAEKAFGHSGIFMEKCIDRARHIEVQVLGDHHGNSLHLLERDCSIQRRHQKLIEIAPSPQITDTQRRQLGEWAVQIASAVGYTNAGTVEFLLAPNGDITFMEVNTRLQVEHPVTEAITGIDIVQQQLRIAAGDPLTIRQEEVTARGYAMELRINAEEPKHDFAPQFGERLGHVRRYLTPGGPGVRIDSALYSGYVIPPHYDSLCAKLIVHASDWPGLLQRARRALRELRIDGVKSTIPYYLTLLEEVEFQEGKFDTGYVTDHPELIEYQESDDDRRKVAAIAATLTAAGLV